MDKILFRKTGSMVYPPHGPVEEGIGSTIIIFYHKINVVLLKKKRCTHCDDCKEDFRVEECLGVHVGLLMKRDLL